MVPVGNLHLVNLTPSHEGHVVVMTLLVVPLVFAFLGLRFPHNYGKLVRSEDEWNTFEHDSGMSMLLFDN